MQLNFNVVIDKPSDKKFNLGNINSPYGIDGLGFTKNNVPFFPISGEFHFSRYPENEWKHELLKMKATGCNVVATYVFWIHHEEVEGQFRFDGDRNVKRFLSICKEINMPCVLRIGPWVHGECVYGGLPKFINKLKGKRKDSTEYLLAVEKFWKRLFKEVSEYCDGSTIIAIQIENEYGGDISHLRSLRSLAEKIGFKTPFFTMTAWPSNKPDINFLPTFGGYPEAPWTQHKKPIKPEGRFVIGNGKTEIPIGEDLVLDSKIKSSFEGYPYAGCEVGPGNQPTQHRRPMLDVKACFGVAFAKFASGMNWIGYYMYHGGRNPLGGLYQESRRTLYPNNYSIVDYDFQAPFSKDGETRLWAKRLKLLHYFTQTWDNNLSTKLPYFAVDRNASIKGEYPYCSIRSDENLSGYLFVSNYERGRNSKDFKNVSFNIKSKEATISLPPINISANAMFFFPFNFIISGQTVDYIIAEPILKFKNTHYYKKIDDLNPLISINGIVKPLKDNDKIGEVNIVLLDEQKAYQLYFINSRVIFSEYPIFEENNLIYVEKSTIIKNTVATLSLIKRINLPYNYYLYSYGKRTYYCLDINYNMVSSLESAIIVFDFQGLNLQLFCDEKLIDDCFNVNGEYRLHTKYLKRFINKNSQLIIKISRSNKFGVGNVYCEHQSINMPPKLTIREVLETQTLDFDSI